MKNFLAQIRSILGPMGALRMEQFIFSRADQMLPGYNGGKWDSVKCGDVWGVKLPTRDKVVTISTPFTSGTGDAKTMSLAFTYLCVAWFWEINADRISDAQNDALSDLKDKLRDFAFSDGSGINFRDFHNLTD